MTADDRNTIGELSLGRGVVLGSRSPQRLALLRTIVPSDQITLLPPRDSDEAGFEGLETLDQFAERIEEIVAAKARDVIGQLDPEDQGIVVCADTTSIGRGADGKLCALGQPPEDDWQEVVRGWFHDYLAGRVHWVLSGVSVSIPGSDRSALFRTCRTEVTMRADAVNWLDWYFSTGEPRGKAGGFAIQGAGSVLVRRVEGSLSNVIGLPLEETIEMLRHVSHASDT